MKKTTISVLGGLTIELPGEISLHRKAKLVAAFLAIQLGQPQSRERIVGLFWEASPEEQARANLRQCLSILRKGFGDALIAERDHVALDSGAVEIDLVRFNDLIGLDDRHSLEQALELYAGDLLDAVSVKEEAFEAYLRAERERVRDLLSAGALRLILACEQAQDVAAVLRYASRLVAHDPLNERMHRKMMRAYASQGRYDAALRQFATCRKTLERELGVQPSPKTIELRAQLLSDRRAAPAQTPAVESLDVSRDLAALGIEFSLSPRPSIILLPFRDLSADGDLSHIAEGIRIDVQSALVKISGLFVIAAGNAALYSDRDASAQQVAREMGVRYVLEGAVLGDASRLRISAQLTDEAAGTIVWSQRYHQAIDDAFQVQDEIVERIVTALDVELVSGEQAKVWRKTLRNPRALELYYRALDRLAEFDKGSVAAARQLAEKVSAISPEVTLGPTLVAFCHYWDVTMCWSANSAQSLNEAEEWAGRASAMEDASGEAHAILAHILLLRGRHQDAMAIAEEAVSIRPLCAMTNALAGNVFLHCGRPVEAIAKVKTAIRAAPVYAAWWAEILAAAYLDLEHYEKAEAAAREAVRKKPACQNGRLTLISALVACDRLPEARENARLLLSHHPAFSISRFFSGPLYQDRAQLRLVERTLKDAGLPD